MPENEMMTDHELTEMVLRVMRQQLADKFPAARPRPTTEDVPAPSAARRPAEGGAS
jgi:hypothetical protein